MKIDEALEMNACKEVDRLNAELAAAREKLDAYEMDGASAAMAVRKAEAERDALRTLLREARKYVFADYAANPILARIDAALNGERND